MAKLWLSSGIYKTCGSMTAGCKDIRPALAAGEMLRVPLPLASLLRDRFLTVLAHNGENLDWPAIGSLAAQDAGT